MLKKLRRRRDLPATYIQLASREKAKAFNIMDDIDSPVLDEAFLSDDELKETGVARGLRERLKSYE